MKIAFIGYGNIAKSLINRLSTIPQYKLFAASPSLNDEILPNGLITNPNNAVIAEDADVIIIAVKPYHVVQVLSEIRSKLNEKTVIISLASGITLDTLASNCPDGQPIVRAMPNTPVSIGMGATALLANAYLSTHHHQLVEALFKPTGETAWVLSDSAINALTALSGSGPAYVFLFAEALIKAGARLDISPELAHKFTLQTIAGALALMQTTTNSPAELRKKVTASGGTTEAAIAVFQQHDFETVISTAINAAYQRAIELSK